MGASRQRLAGPPSLSNGCRDIWASSEPSHNLRERHALKCPLDVCLDFVQRRLDRANIKHTATFGAFHHALRNHRHGTLNDSDDPRDSNFVWILCESVAPVNTLM